MRLIDADELKEDLRHYFTDGVLDGISAKLAFNQILHDIDNAPTVKAYTLEDVEPTIKVLDKRPVGKWIFQRDRDASGGAFYKCSLCKIKYSVGAYFEINEENYCPNCGSQMKEV